LSEEIVDLRGKNAKNTISMSNFVIFEDQENVKEKAVTSFAETKRDRQKLAPLTNKAIYDENALENQVRKKIPPLCPFSISFTCFLYSSQIPKSLKPSTSTTSNISAAFKQKNVFTEKEVVQKVKVQETYHEEESIINVTSEEVSWSGDGLEASASFT
jgi:uncharacterized protein YgiM (DUF1202 family)